MSSGSLLRSNRDAPGAVTRRKRASENQSSIENHAEYFGAGDPRIGDQNNHASEDQSQVTNGLESGDRWTTYKDFMRKKRDYKREWRRRKQEEDRARQKRYQNIVDPSQRQIIISNVLLPEYEHLRMAIRLVPDHDSEAEAPTTPPESTFPGELISDQPEGISGEPIREDDVEEEEAEIEEGEGANIEFRIVEEEQHEELINECPETVPENVTSNVEIITAVEEHQELVLENDVEFSARWEYLRQHLDSLPLPRRLRYLKIFEEIVDLDHS